MSEESFAESVTPYRLLYNHDVTRNKSNINHFIEHSEAGDVREQLLHQI